MAKIVHLLVSGRAMCGLTGAPNTWPENHYWVSLEDMHEVNCQECLQRGKERQKGDKV